jgi:outer membrane lipoprotein-sorting protein
MSRSDPFDCVESRTASVEFMDLSAGQDPKVFHFNGPELAIYFPKAGEIQVIKERQYASIVNRMLLIGFSVSRDEMKKDYSLALNGAEKAGSVPATRIILTPKSRDVLKTITAIDLWIPDGQGYAIRQKVTRHNGDYDLTGYSNLQVNPSLPDSAFELTVPPGTKRVQEN